MIISPSVSFLITFYDVNSLINRAILSALNSNYDNFDVILVDDGSSDIKFVDESLLRHTRVQYYKIPHYGRAYALNYGLSLSASKYIAILDYDDFTKPERLEIQTSLLESTGSSLCYSNASFISKDETTIFNSSYPLSHDDISKHLFNLNPFPHSSVMYNREYILGLGGYSQSISKSLDFNLYLSILMSSGTLIGTKENLVSIQISQDSWGREDNQNLQFMYGLYGLSRYHLYMSYGIDIYSKDDLFYSFNKFFKSIFLFIGFSNFHVINKAIKNPTSLNKINLLFLAKNIFIFIFKLPVFLIVRTLGYFRVTKFLSHIWRIF